MSLGAPTVVELKTSKEARGKRLKIARMQTGLSRAELEKKYGVSRLTQGNWENGKAGGLTEKGAKRMVYALKEEGLHCTLEWLLDGIGSAPYPTDRVFLGDESIQALRVSETIGFPGIEEERLTFRRCNKDAIDLRVEDDGMLPFYRIGDYVAGIQYFGAEIEKAVGQDCIVLLKNKRLLLRHLRQAEEDGFSLVCIYPDAKIRPYLLENQEIISAAPVIWHRRKNI